jgi:SAM-dependent methyltransferase
MATADRYARERQFHDVALADGRRRTIGKYYAADRASRRFYQRLLAAALEGMRVLEYGCGRGSAAFLLARQGCLVTGIDISDEGIRQARERAEEDALQIRFEVMNAEDLDFAAGSFDLVCGSGILHHLELESAYREIGRVLAEDGRAVFVEPLGHNPLINLYRWATPALRTVDEHPLVMADIRMGERYFSTVRATFFSLSTLAAVPLRRTPWFERALGALETLDRGLFKIPALRHSAWQVVLELERPRA